MKKINSKLLLAAAGLGLAVASTVGSTYAWFSENGTVSATGAKVSIKASGSLAISKKNDDATAWAQSISFSDEEASITAVPCAPKNSSNLGSGFYKLTGEGMKNVNPVNGVYSGAAYSADDSYFTTATDKKDYVHVTFYLKASQDLTVTPSVSLPEKAATILNALNVALVFGTAAPEIKCFNSDKTLTFTSTTVGTSIVTVNAYAWFDGNDADCTSTNAATEVIKTLEFSFAGKKTS